MAGDKSDNIEGIGGVGLKTVSKRFPFLKEEKAATFDDVISHSKQSLREKTIKAYQNVLEKKAILKRNYKMMQLYAPMLLYRSKETLERH
jgi:5'-3' exonuclease